MDRRFQFTRLLQFGTRCALLALKAFACTMTPSVQAEPITLRFEAEIGTIFTGIPFDSGIEFAQGDVIIGQFTFEPTVGDGSTMLQAIQPYEFVLSINGAIVVAPSFEIELFNDTYITDFPPASRVDSMMVGAANLTPIRPEMYPNIDAATSGFRMSLLGPTDALDQAGIPQTAANWNQFDLWRQIHVSFENDDDGAIGFQAAIRQFVEVPEPSTYWLMSLLLMIAFAMYRTRFTTRTSFI